MNPVVRFEMPCDDPRRMAKFYEQACDRRTQALGAEMGNYVRPTTTAKCERGPKRPGAINGGYFPGRPDWPAHAGAK
jgi:predicted enzyme related to lactoylglutathione lyase